MFRKTSLLVFLSTVLGVVPCIAESFQDQQKDYFLKIKENVYPILGASAAVVGSATYWLFGRRRQSPQVARLDRAAERLALALAGISSSTSGFSDDSSYARGKNPSTTSAKKAVLSTGVVAAARRLIHLLQSTTITAASTRDAIRAAVAGLVRAEFESANINQQIIDSVAVQNHLQQIYNSLTAAALDSREIVQIAEGEEINLGNLPGIAEQVTQLVVILRRIPSSNEEIKKLVIELIRKHIRNSLNDILTPEDVASYENQIFNDPEFLSRAMGNENWQRVISYFITLLVQEVIVNSVQLDALTLQQFIDRFIYPRMRSTLFREGGLGECRADTTLMELIKKQLGIKEW